MNARITRFAVALGLAFACALAQAQAWPSRQIHIVVAFPPGGSTDIAVRAVSVLLAKSLGQPVVVENRAGAGGNIGADYVSKQPADGYTILATADALTSNPHLYKMSLDPQKDFVPVIQLTRQPIVLAVHPSTGVNSVAELIAQAKAKPGMGFATSGAGSGQHIVGEWFSKLSGAKLTHVPYKGGGQAIVDLLGGQVPIGSLGSTPVIPHHKSGKLKIIAQTTASRSPSLPDIPTYQEAGIDGLVLDQWLGLFVPAGTPAALVERLNAEVNKALGDAALRDRFAQSALEAVGGSQAQFSRLFREDHEKYGRLIKELAIKLE
ncbi:MAG: tripartite tricarboxylate transporter substrate binding protein [Burkholderiaceae bacterium]|nr:tripartite tricarboxylate transporter substrate binding protein [Burkholderiaceae bacterium]